jgi:hypothetical protein
MHRVGPNQDFLNTIALNALESARVEVHAPRHDTGQHHRGLAFRTDRAFNCNRRNAGMSRFQFWHQCTFGSGEHVTELSDREPPNTGGDETIMARAVLESASNIAHSQKFNQ